MISQNILTLHDILCSNLHHTIMNLSLTLIIWSSFPSLIVLKFLVSSPTFNPGFCIILITHWPVLYRSFSATYYFLNWIHQNFWRLSALCFSTHISFHLVNYNKPGDFLRLCKFPLAHGCVTWGYLHRRYPLQLPPH